MYVPKTVHVKTCVVDFLSWLPSLTSLLNPVVPGPPPAPEIEFGSGWFSCCCSCAQLEKMLDSMLAVRSTVDSGGSRMPATINAAVATRPLSQKSDRA